MQKSVSFFSFWIVMILPLVKNKKNSKCPILKLVNPHLHQNKASLENQAKIQNASIISELL